jgi:hypothetical protein
MPLPKPIVFISHAHESEPFRESVRQLTKWLEGEGCQVLTDHTHRHRPPPEGWQAWMLRCVRDADTVLVVCSPKYRARFEKTAPLGSGQGVTYEGAILTQDIYDASMRNEKFYPILPDDGAYDDIPTALRAWWNNHRFPSGNEGIRNLIFDVLAQSDSAHFDLNDIDRDPTDAQMNSLMADVAAEVRRKAARAQAELMARLRAEIAAAATRRLP